MTIQHWAWLGVAVGFAICGVLARVLYVEEQRDRAPAERAKR